TSVFKKVLTAIFVLHLIERRLDFGTSRYNVPITPQVISHAIQRLIVMAMQHVNRDKQQQTGHRQE
ncbi:MAG: hypothetical protein WAQ56_04010, partial [Candidatus Nitrotoga sp.]